MMAEPQQEHRWLDKLVGEWASETECHMGPDQPAMKSRGVEVVRSVGGLWVVAEGGVEMPGGGTSTTIMTLHALAGEAAAGDEGDDGMIASDIVDRLPRALRALRLAP